MSVRKGLSSLSISLLNFHRKITRQIKSIVSIWNPYFPVINIEGIFIYGFHSIGRPCENHQAPIFKNLFGFYGYISHYCRYYIFSVGHYPKTFSPIESNSLWNFACRHGAFHFHIRIGKCSLPHRRKNG